MKFDESNDEVVKIPRGDVNIIWISNLLHQWNWETEAQTLHQIISLSKPSTIVAGQHAGMTLGGLPSVYEGHRGSYMHDSETWRKFREQVCKETGTIWDVEVGKLVEWEEIEVDIEKMKDFARNTKPLIFMVRRVDAGNDCSALVFIDS